MTQGGDRRARAGGRSYLSWALFAISALLFVVVAYLYFKPGGEDAKPIPTPPAVVGKNEMINVKQALERQGLQVAFAAGGARSDSLSEAGQLLQVDGAPLYVFVYPGVTDRANDTAGIDLAALMLLDIRGTPVAAGPLDVSMGSNVVAILAGGDAALAAKVHRAVEGLL